MNLLQIRKRSTSFALPFRHREVGRHVLITNTEGNFLLLEPAEFQLFVEGDVVRDTDLWKRLKERNFIRGEENRDSMVERVRARKTFLSYGANLHIIVVTLRCNETCVYCHASRANMDAVHTDMTKETAERTVDKILETTNPNVTLEFQGGEPLVNFPVVQHIIEYALEANKKVGK